MLACFISNIGIKCRIPATRPTYSSVNFTREQVGPVTGEHVGQVTGKHVGQVAGEHVGQITGEHDGQVTGEHLSIYLFIIYFHFIYS